MATQLNDWLSIDKISGTGNAEITLTASSYEELVDRTTSLKIQGISANAILNVRQNAMIPTITLSNSHFFFDYNGEKYLKTVIISNVDWSVSSSDNWFYVSHDYGTKGETVFKVEVTENKGEKRDGMITFSFNGEVYATLYITQYGLISFANDIMTFGYIAETQQNKVLIDFPWYIIKDGDWFTVAPSNGNDVSNITVSVEENDSLRRTGKISLFSTDGDFFLGEIIVRQKSEFDSQYMWIETEENAIISAYPAIDYSFDCLTWGRATDFSMDGHNIVYIRKGDEIKYIRTDKYYYAFSSENFSVGGNSISFGTNLIRFFINRTTLIDASELDISGVTLGYGMFEGCTNLKYPPKTLPYGNFDNFAYMFAGCTSLITAPELPAISLPNYYFYREESKNTIEYITFGGCYERMFAGCTSLTTPPQLPATILGSYCYNGMFYGCTNLKIAPVLPAIKMKQGCYGIMFYECSNLTTAPELPATDLSYNSTDGPTPSGCYYSMFKRCTSLTTAPALPATTLSKGCYEMMFADCDSLTTAPELPATTLAVACYSSMFYGCDGLTTAPVLPATTLAEGCYSVMFAFCSRINYIKMLAYNNIGGNLTNWVANISTNGTFVKHPDAVLPNGSSGIPHGWTVETATE